MTFYTWKVYNTQEKEL